MNLFLIQM